MTFFKNVFNLKSNRKFNRSALITASLALAFTATGCGEQNYVQQQPMPVQSVALPNCPVPQEMLPNVFRGDYGTDALQRPLNPDGFPVDVNGNCITQAPVSVVYNGYPAPLYIGILTNRYGYSYYGGGLYYGGGYMGYGSRLWSSPGVTVHRTYVQPTQRVRTVQTVKNYQAPRTTNRTTVGAPARGTGANQGQRPTSGGTAQSPGQRPKTDYNRTQFNPTTSRGTTDYNKGTGNFAPPAARPTQSAPSRSTPAPQVSRPAYRPAASPAYRPAASPSYRPAARSSSGGSSSGRRR
jgi:hypothetical protein